MRRRVLAQELESKFQWGSERCSLVPRPEILETCRIAAKGVVGAERPEQSSSLYQPLPPPVVGGLVGSSRP